MFNVIVAPAFGVTAKVKDFAFGVGIFVPFGGSASWSPNQSFANSTKYAGPFDGTQRWYLIDGTIQSLYISAAAAYKIPGTGLSLGVSGNLIRSAVNLLRARTTDGSNDITEEGRSLPQRVRHSRQLRRRRDVRSHSEDALDYGLVSGEAEHRGRDGPEGHAPKQLRRDAQRAAP